MDQMYLMLRKAKVFQSSTEAVQKEAAEKAQQAAEAAAARQKIEKLKQEAAEKEEAKQAAEALCILYNEGASKSDLQRVKLSGSLYGMKIGSKKP